MYYKKLKALISVLVAAVILCTVVPFSSAAVREYTYCDLDGNGQTDAADARAALRFSVDLDYYTKGHLEQCGIAERFSAADARFILRLAVGLESTEFTSVSISDEAFSQYVNKPSEDGLFRWEIPEEPEIDAPSGTFTFTVYGYGHGVGMSQYGANNLAKLGYDYKEILNYFYTGCTLQNIANL